MTRNAEPTKLKILKGVRPSRINHQEVVSEAPVPVLPMSDRALEFWALFAPALITDRILTDRDAAAFVQWCEAAALAEQASKLVDEQGILVDGGKRNQAISVWRDSVTVMNQISSRFGMSPSDRSRIIPNAPNKDDLEEKNPERLI